MDRKFFFFRREPESEASASFSDTGVGLSTIAIPSENLTFITAGKKKVVFTFKDCNGFDESTLQEGESIPKANITVACKEGDEAGLIEDVINFMSRDTAKNIMKFDVVDGKSTFDKAIVDTVDDVRSVIPSAPINTITKEISVGDEAKKFQQTIAEITFPGDLPFIDFNHEMLSSFADTDAYADTPNAGTHNIDIADVGGVAVFDENTDKTLVKKSVAIGSGSAISLGPDTTITSSDYTIYVALNSNLGAGLPEYGLGTLYGSANGECFGFGGVPKNDGAIGSTNNDFLRTTDVFCVRHEGVDGAAAFSSTTSSIDGTKPFSIPDSDSSSVSYDPNHIFIIRRDKNFNMFLHNRDGDIISKIPAKTTLLNPSLTSSSPGRTDGDLTIRMIGRVGGQNIPSKFYLYRFGVIKNDIGANDAANLAKQLSKVYGTK